MIWPPAIAREPEHGSEGRAALAAALLHDIPIQSVVLQDLPDLAPRIHAGDVLPIGGVPFVMAAMRCAGIPAPLPLSYPESLAPFLGRVVHKTNAGDALARTGLFVKPVQTKLFTGFVLRSPGEMQAHEALQYEALCALPKDTPVWTSPVVNFLAEWRLYLVNGAEAGRARYDPDGTDDAPPLDEQIIADAVSALAGSWQPGLPHCALDFGVTADGRTLLVEANDGYSLGLYGGSLHPAEYLKLLWGRWQQLLSAIPT